jgi:type I restriction enzyme R subunit
MTLTEAMVKEAALGWFEQLGYAAFPGPQVAPGEPAAERESFSDVVLVGRLREAIRQLNPAIPDDAREEALRKLLRLATPSLMQTNRVFHRLLREGVTVEYPRPDGSIAGDHVRLVDFTAVAANDWLVVNQFSVSDGQHNRRPDLLVFLNGLPLGLIELKNAASEGATIWSAYAQLQTYKAEIPSLLQYNAALVVSDGLQARIGSLTANQEWFKLWRSIDGETEAPTSALELETLIRGVFEPQRFLDLLQHFIVFEEDPDSDALHKIIAGYHQFHAVNAAVEETVRASGMGSVARSEGGPAGRPPRRRGVAHPGQWQELLDALLCRPHRAPSGDAEPHPGGTHRSQRPRRPALRAVPALRRPPRPNARAGRQSRTPARATQPGQWRRCVHHDPEVHAGKGRSDARAECPAEHRGDRR